MTTILGPFNRAQWKTMLMLKYWISFYKDNNIDGKYNDDLQRDREAYKRVLSKAA